MLDDQSWYLIILMQFYHHLLVQVKSIACRAPKLISILTLFFPHLRKNSHELFPLYTISSLSSPQPKNTTSNMSHNSKFTSGRIRSKPCLNPHLGSKPNQPPLICGPTSSPTSPLSLPLPSPISSLDALSILHKISSKGTYYIDKTPWLSTTSPPFTSSSYIPPP